MKRGYMMKNVLTELGVLKTEGFTDRFNLMLRGLEEECLMKKELTELDALKIKVLIDCSDLVIANGLGLTDLDVLKPGGFTDRFNLMLRGLEEDEEDCIMEKWLPELDVLKIKVFTNRLDLMIRGLEAEGCEDIKNTRTIESGDADAVTWGRILVDTFDFQTGLDRHVYRRASAEICEHWFELTTGIVYSIRFYKRDVKAEGKRVQTAYLLNLVKETPDGVVTYTKGSDLEGLRACKAEMEAYL